MVATCRRSIRASNRAACAMSYPASPPVPTAPSSPSRGGPEKVRIGIAKVDPRRCLTFKGELCTRCYDACPYPYRALMMIGSRPLVGSGACTGCGLCEYACPTHPKAIEIVPERDLVPGLRIPRNEYSGPGEWGG